MTRWRARLSVVATLIVASLTIASYVLAASTPGGSDLLADSGWPLSFLAIGLIGGFLAVRRPDNVIGPLMAAVSVPMLLSAAGVAYTTYGTANPDAPALVIASWLGYWLWMPATTLLAMVILLFPTGRPPTPRWRTIVVLMLLQLAGVIVGGALLLPSWEPAFSDATTPGELPGGALLDWVGNAVAALLLGIACLALVVRRRQADDVERLQLKWLLLAVTGMALVSLSPFFAGLEDPMGNDGYAIGVQVSLTAIPVCIAIAILRYRLYDIDRVVSRTVSYALLTGVLVGVYALGVLGIGALLPGERSDLLVAGSTLAAAALFRPLRARIQSMVDRRFNRSRYDAGRTVGAFSARLRDEVDLGSLMTQLRGVVEETVQPRVTSVWLRKVPT